MSTAWKIIIGVLLAVVATFTIGVLSGKIWWFSEDPPLMVIPDMDDQFHLKPQGEARFLPTIARSGSSRRYAPSSRAQLSFCDGRCRFG